jgi:hypothetical protein
LCEYLNITELKKNNQIKFGIALILLSGVAFAVMLIVPFLHIEKESKVLWASVAFIAMEVLFYSGGFLVGKELFKKYKSYLNPKNWFNKKSMNSTAENQDD